MEAQLGFLHLERNMVATDLEQHVDPTYILRIQINQSKSIQKACATNTTADNSPEEYWEVAPGMSPSNSGVTVIL